MMTLQGWRGMYPEAEKQNYMKSKLWSRLAADCTWELAVVDEIAIKELYHGLSECQQRVMDTLLDGILLQGIQENELISILTCKLARPSHSLLSALQAFAEAGLVNVLRHPWQGRYWIMPMPIYHSLRAALRHPLDHSSGCICTELSHALLSQAHYAQPLKLSNRLLLFLHSLSGQSLMFTRQGELSKVSMKQLQKHQQQYSTKETLAALVEGWQLFFPEAKGGLEGFFLELALDLGLLERYSLGLSWNVDKLEGWLSLSQHNQDEMIWQWLLQQLSSYSNISLIAFLHDVMLSSGHWVFYDHDYYSSHSDSDNRGSGDSRSDVMDLKLMQFLCECGLLSFVYEAVGEETVLLQEGIIYAIREHAPPSYDKLHLELNGELLALPGTSSVLIWQALNASELVSAQETLMLRLTPHSLDQAIFRGYSIEELTNWLEQLNDGELPVLIQQLLNSLALPAASVKKEPVTQAIKLSTVKEATLLYELRILNQWGYYCQNPLGNLVGAEPISVKHLYSYDGSTNIIERIPRSWQYELRGYHRSTMVKIVEAAIEYGLGLYVKSKGMLQRLVPQKLEARDGEYVLYSLNFAQPAGGTVEIAMVAIEAIGLDNDEENHDLAIGILPGV